MAACTTTSSTTTRRPALDLPRRLDGGSRRHAHPEQRRRLRNRLERTGGIAIGSERGGTVEHVRVFNNIVVEAKWTGIILSNTGHDSPEGRRTASRHPDLEQHGLRVQRQRRRRHLPVTTNLEGIVIQNNLIAFGGNWNGQITAATSDVLAQLTVDHNLVFAQALLSGLPELRGAERLARQRHGRPAARDPAAFDFHPLPGSPAIDTGSRSTP